MRTLKRSGQSRNVVIALVNGAVMLVVLRAASLGWMTVVLTTALVMVTTYIAATLEDRVMQCLQANTPLRSDRVDRPEPSEPTCFNRRPDGCS